MQRLTKADNASKNPSSVSRMGKTQWRRRFAPPDVEMTLPSPFFPRFYKTNDQLLSKERYPFGTGRMTELNRPCHVKNTECNTDEITHRVMLFEEWQQDCISSFIESKKHTSDITLEIVENGSHNIQGSDIIAGKKIL